MLQPPETTGETVEVEVPVAQADAPEIESAADAYALLSGKLEGWLETAVLKLPNLMVALLVVLLFWLAAVLVRKAIRQGLSHTPLALPIRNLLVSLVGVAIVTTGFFTALGVMGLDKTVTSLLAGVGILGLALGFALQSIAANFMAGVFLSVRRPFSIGDVIETNDFFGTVREINLRSTVLHRPTGQLVRIPNKEVFETPLVNYTSTGRRRVDLTVGVSYGDDLEQAERLAIEAVEGVPGRLSGEPVELYYEGFGDSSIELVVRFWIPFRRQTEFLAAQSEAVKRIKSAFDQGGVTIPFPIRTLDFGIVGGEKLSDVLRATRPAA